MTCLFEGHAMVRQSCQGIQIGQRTSSQCMDVRSNFMEFLHRSSATAVVHVSPPPKSRVPIPNNNPHWWCPFSNDELWNSKRIVLLFWIIIAERDLEWSRWNCGGPMKLQRMHAGAATVVDLFSFSFSSFWLLLPKTEDHHPPDRLVSAPWVD